MSRPFDVALSRIEIAETLYDGVRFIEQTFFVRLIKKYGI